LECSTQIFFISRRDKYLDFSEFINVLYCSLLTVMAAELVNAARSENDSEPERLRLEFVVVYTKPNVFKYSVFKRVVVGLIFCAAI